MTNNEHNTTQDWDNNNSNNKNIRFLIFSNILCAKRLGIFLGICLTCQDCPPMRDSFQMLLNVMFFIYFNSLWFYVYLPIIHIHWWIKYIKNTKFNWIWNEFLIRGPSWYHKLSRSEIPKQIAHKTSKKQANPMCNVIL